MAGAGGKATVNTPFVGGSGTHMALERLTAEQVDDAAVQVGPVQAGGQLFIEV